MNRKYHFAYKVPGNRWYQTGTVPPISAIKITKHLSVRAAQAYADEMNRQQYEREEGTAPIKKLRQMELGI